MESEVPVAALAMFVNLRRPDLPYRTQVCPRYGQNPVNTGNAGRPIYAVGTRMRGAG
jgi:hypothetical protein